MKTSGIGNQEGAKKQNNTSSCCSSMSRQTTCTPSSNPSNIAASKNSTTKIIIKYNCGFPNNLFIRGEGLTGLNWDRGIAMKNVKADEWMWESDKPFDKVQFKIVLNDRIYEQGANHSIECGKIGIFSPKF